MAKKSSSTTTVKHHRDAGSGEYVSENYAKKHPKTTVTETDKIKRKGNWFILRRLLLNVPCS